MKPDAVVVDRTPPAVAAGTAVHGRPDGPLPCASNGAPAPGPDPAVGCALVDEVDSDLTATVEGEFNFALEVDSDEDASCRGVWPMGDEDGEGLALNGIFVAPTPRWGLQTPAPVGVRTPSGVLRFGAGSRTPNGMGREILEAFDVTQPCQTPLTDADKWALLFKLNRGYGGIRRGSVPEPRRRAFSSSSSAAPSPARAASPKPVVLSSSAASLHSAASSRSTSATGQLLASCVRTLTESLSHTFSAEGGSSQHPAASSVAQRGEESSASLVGDHATQTMASPEPSQMKPSIRDIVPDSLIPVARGGFGELYVERQACDPQFRTLTAKQYARLRENYPDQKWRFRDVAATADGWVQLTFLEGTPRRCYKVIPSRADAPAAVARATAEEGATACLLRRIRPAFVQLSESRACVVTMDFLPIDATRLRKLPVGEVLRQFALVAEFLHREFHGKDLVYVDIKPDNMRLAVGRDDRLYLILVDSGSVRHWMTRGSATPSFSAAEVMNGAPVPGSDVYALGLTLAWALAEHFRPNPGYGHSDYYAHLERTAEQLSRALLRRLGYDGASAAEVRSPVDARAEKADVVAEVLLDLVRLFKAMTHRTADKRPSMLGVKDGLLALAEHADAVDRSHGAAALDRAAATACEAGTKTATWDETSGTLPLSDLAPDGFGPPEDGLKPPPVEAAELGSPRTHAPYAVR